MRILFRQVNDTVADHDDRSLALFILLDQLGILDGFREEHTTSSGVFLSSTIAFRN